MKKFYIAFLFIILPFVQFGCAQQQTVGDFDSASQMIKACERLLNKKHYEEAVDCFDNLKARYPGGNVSRAAELKVAETFFQQKDYLLAAEVYQNFIKLYPGGARTDYAYYRAGLSLYRASPKAIDRDQSYILNAMPFFETVIYRYPSSSYKELARNYHKACKNRLARRSFYIGRLYYRRGEYIAASSRFDEVSKSFPGSDLAAKALFMNTKALSKLGKIAEAKESFSQLSLHYPESSWKKRAEKVLRSAVK